MSPRLTLSLLNKNSIRWRHIISSNKMLSFSLMGKVTNLSNTSWGSSIKDVRPKTDFWNPPCPTSSVWKTPPSPSTDVRIVSRVKTSETKYILQSGLPITGGGEEGGVGLWYGLPKRICGRPSGLWPPPPPSSAVVHIGSHTPLFTGRLWWMAPWALAKFIQCNSNRFEAYPFV